MKTPHQFLRFCLIGVLNTVIQYLVFILLFRALGLPMLLSSALGFMCGMVNSYLLNRRLTFKVQHGWTVSEFMKFFLINLLAMGTNLFVLKVLVFQVEMLPEVAQVIAISGSLVVNFIGNKLWTFKSLGATE